MSPKRISQLMIAFSAWMFIAAVWALVVAKVLHSTHPVRVAQESNIRNGLNRIDDIETLRKICVGVFDASHVTERMGWDFLFWGVGLVLVCSAVFGAAAYRLQHQLKVVEASSGPASQAARLFDAAFEGRLESWKAFWGGFVFIPIMTMIVVGGSVALLRHSGLIEKVGAADFLVTPLAASAISVVYLAGAIAAWRSASNAGPVWKYLARGAIAVLTIIPVVRSLGVISYMLFRF